AQVRGEHGPRRRSHTGLGRISEPRGGRSGHRALPLHAVHSPGTRSAHRASAHPTWGSFRRERELMDAGLREKRESIVREHMESENRHEFDVTLGTFDHPRYEIVATGDVHDGPEEVMRYFKE